jgi:hypothetical protein
MSNSPSFRFPFSAQLADQSNGVKEVHRNTWNAITDLNQAIASLKGQIPAASAATTTATATTSTTAGVTSFNAQSGAISYAPGLGYVNNQSGVTAYVLAATDNGILLVLNDASPVTVTLNSTLARPFTVFITNYGAGAVTLTASSGSVNGPTSLPINVSVMAGFDGTNWWVSEFPTIPATFNAITHEFLISYNSSTGSFTAAQPAFTDISGQITTSQLPSAGLSATIVTAKLTGGGANGSMTFTNGILTASTPAT